MSFYCVIFVSLQNYDEQRILPAGNLKRSNRVIFLSFEQIKCGFSSRLNE